MGYHPTIEKRCCTSFPIDHSVPYNMQSTTCYFAKESTLTMNNRLITRMQNLLGIIMILLGLQSYSLIAAEVLIPASPSIAAKSYFLQDYDSGQILVEHNADLRLAPASLTKIMTVYVVLREMNNGNLTLDEKTRISEKAWRTPGSRMFVEVNDMVAIKDLLRGVIIQSGNDATVALAEHVAGNEATFAELMNQHAARLGMVNTHFTDSNGLPAPEHFSTARDLSMLTKAMIMEFPAYYAWFAEKEFTYNKISQPNRNKLLWRDPSVDGVKTGYTEDAGYCLVASAIRNKMRLISVVMGTKSVKARTNETQSLLNYGFRFFETHRLYSAGESLTESKVWKGDSDQVNMGLHEDLYVTVPRRHYGDLKAMMSIDNTIMAPIAKGQVFGSVVVSLGDKALVKKPLVALSAVAEGSIIQQFFDEALLSFE